MITKRHFFKTLQPGLLTASIGTVALIFGSSMAFAQIKIGTNPTVIDANSNLEVEGSINGRKMTVDKATGKVTIADASQGAGKVFTSDANGVGTWIAPASQDSPVLFSLDKSTGADQAVPQSTTTYTKANFGAEVFDKGNNFDLTTDVFTVPANGAGYYQINGYFHSVGGWTHSLGAYMHVFVNGSSRRILCSGNAPVGTGIVAGGSVVVKLNAGDTIDFRFVATSSDVIVDEANVDVYLISR